MFTLWKTFRFEAAHQLANHDGKCARLHGHSWIFRLFVKGEYLQLSGPQENMLTDYFAIGMVGKAQAEMLDHRNLNDLFETNMPTSEYLARRIFETNAPLLAGLFAVEVEETCTSGCRYEP